MDKEKLKVNILGTLGGFILYALNRSLRWEVVDPNGKETDWRTRETAIFCFWHNRQLLGAGAYYQMKREGKPGKSYILISKHSDGRLIARGVRLFKLNSVAGSSSSGGGRALHTLIAVLKRGDSVIFTPDGPRGPLYKAKQGIAIASKKSATPVYCGGIAAEKFWRFGSWDKMIMPKPFSKAVLIIGEGLHPSEDESAESLEIYRKQIENELRRVTEMADCYWN